MRLGQDISAPVVFPHQAVSSARARLSGPPDKATVTRCVLETCRACILLAKMLTRLEALPDMLLSCSE